MNIARDFISKLSARFRKENDLSDITWALCESSPEFTKLFVSFFFNELKDVSGISLQREYTRGSSRPDFYLVKDDQEYIIEVKKGDMNDHLDQYRSDFPHAKRGWIANYKRTLDEGFKIKTWEDFHSYIESELNTQEFESSELISGYNDYLKSVCSIIKFKPMRLANLDSLYYFNKLILRVIERDRPGVKIGVYNSAKSTFEDRSGCYFTITKNETPDNKAYPWFGTWYDDKSVSVYFCFREDWCKGIYDGLMQQQQKDGKYFKPFLDESYWFEMKPEYFTKINSLNSFPEQEEIVNAFFDEVIERIKVYL